MSDNPKTFFEREVERLAEKYALPGYQYVLIRQSRAFIQEYYAEKIELERMAAAAFMSRFHYIRIFQCIYGVTPGQYLRDVRISKAKELLKKGLPVTQVCLDVGYTSLPTFSNIFKRATGCSPKTYQNRNNSNLE